MELIPMAHDPDRTAFHSTAFHSAAFHGNAFTGSKVYIADFFGTLTTL
jgi:hypothetical protein